MPGSLTLEMFLLNLSGRMIIVGNGPISRDYGALVDTYDVVVRINNYLLKGYERTVGTKTTVRLVSTWYDVESYNRTIEICPFTANSAECYNVIGYKSKSLVPLILPHLDVHQLVPDYSSPSTGLAFLVLANHLGIRFDAIGFDGLRNGCHYWGRGTSSIHCPGREAAIHGQLKFIKFFS